MKLPVFTNSRAPLADSMPRGLVTFGASASRPGENASEELVEINTTTQSHATTRQRREGRRPSGKSSTMKVPIRTTAGTQSQFVSQAMYTAPGREPDRVCSAYT